MTTMSYLQFHLDHVSLRQDPILVIIAGYPKNWQFFYEYCFRIKFYFNLWLNTFLDFLLNT